MINEIYLSVSQPLQNAALLPDVAGVCDLVPAGPARTLHAAAECNRCRAVVAAQKVAAQKSVLASNLNVQEFCTGFWGYTRLF